MLRSAWIGLWVGAVSGLSAPCAAPGDDYQSGTPFTYLFDTGSSSPRPLSSSALAAKTGWIVLAEDDVAHRFRGDVVLLNDKLTVVLRAQGPGAEVYSPTAAGMKYRLVLIPLPAGGRSLTGWSSVKILENNPGAVMVEAPLHTARGRRLIVVCRLTTGQRVLEIRPGKGADRLVVWGKSRYLLVPDFFADDMVFGPAAFDRPRLGLPAENFSLSLLEGGDAIAMCVWKSSRQDATALLYEDGERRVVGGCEIQCTGGRPVWVALMESPDIWHGRVFSADDRGKEIVLDWRPPFPARWRADFVRPDGVAESCNFNGSPPDDGPCRFDADRAVVRIPPAEETSPVERPRGTIVVYPIDRSRATPLTAFCPTDVLRNTLGVGPCQYVLQTEGLASDANPTPQEVINWIEKQFAKKKARESSGQIRQLLGQMTEHVAEVQAKIERYAALARDVQALCAAEKQNGQASAAAETLGRIAGRLERTVAVGRGATEPAERAAKLAGAIVGLIGGQDAPAELRRLGAEVRALGVALDRTLSKCRMTVRWLRQQAREYAGEATAGAALAGRVQARAEQVLQNIGNHDAN